MNHKDTVSGIVRMRNLPIEDHEGQNEGVLIVGMENHPVEAINASELARDILNKYADLDYLNVKNWPPLPKLSLTTN